MLPESARITLLGTRRFSKFRPLVNELSVIRDDNFEKDTQAHLSGINTTQATTQSSYHHYQTYHLEPPTFTDPYHYHTMSNVFFYEPYYDIDRFLEEAFAVSCYQPRNSNQGQRNVDGAMKSLKPRYVIDQDQSQ